MMPKHALVVEADRLVLSVIIDMLQDMGLQAHSAKDGVEAIALLQTAAPIDIVVTNLLMPEISGWEVFTAARDRSPFMPVVFVTGFIPQTLWRSVGRDARAEVIDKPFTFEQLETAVNTVMADDCFNAG
jgi:CheY-like chemotaxis protein